jgi:arylsulfatase A-like enzyme
MTIRQFPLLPSALVLGSIALGAGTSLWADNANAPSAKAPNVLLILLDDLGYADLGCQGSPDIRTPHIDALAASGVRFTAGYVPVSVCGPSRASLLTGKYSAEFGLPGNRQAEIGIPHEHTTIAEHLQRIGYETHLIGKWHLGHTDDQTPMARGFDSFLGLLGGSSHFFPFSPGGNKWNSDRDKTPMQGTRDILEHYRIVDLDRSTIQHNGRELGVGDFPPDTYLTDLFSEEAIRFIQKERDVPFFLFLSHTAPHGPIMAPDHYLERNMHIEDPRRRILAGMMTAVDDGVGRIIQTLNDQGMMDNTLIIFLSDNGGPTRINASLNTPFRGVKGDVFEGGVRVPYIVSWPGVIPAATVIDEPVSSLDLYPTILARAGIKPEEDLPGVDLIPWLMDLNRSPGLHEKLYFWRANARAIRMGDYKLTNFQPGDRSELFNIVENYREDPEHQLQDPERKQKLADLLRVWEESWQPSLAEGPDSD